MTWTAVLIAGSLLAVLLTAALVREVRARRALRRLLVRLFDSWRKRHGKETGRQKAATRADTLDSRPEAKHLPTDRFKLLAALTASSLALCGCSRTDRQDARLTELAKHTQTQQAKQNEQIAKQSEAVVNESAKLAEAAKELVAQDANARRELIDAQQSLQGNLNSERSRLDSQKDRLESERRAIAAQRHRDPIIAQAIAGFALTIACLSPLAVCVYLLRQLRDDPGDDRALGEYLVQELLAEEPSLLTSEPDPPPALEQPARRIRDDEDRTDDGSLAA